MKKSLIIKKTTLLILLFSITSNVHAINRYGYNSGYTEPNNYPSVKEPIVQNLAHDFKFLGEELGKAFIETRNQLKRAFGKNPNKQSPLNRYRYNQRKVHRSNAEPEPIRSNITPTSRNELLIKRKPKEIEPYNKNDFTQISSQENKHSPRERKTNESQSKPLLTPLPTTEPPPSKVPETTKKKLVPETKPGDLPESPSETKTSRQIYSEAEKRNFPLATKTDKVGLVKSPYPPFETLDVRGLVPGDLAKEPDTERIFRIPK